MHQSDFKRGIRSERSPRSELISVPHARGMKEKQVTVHSNTGKPKTITGNNLKPKHKKKYHFQGVN